MKRVITINHNNLSSNKKVEMNFAITRGASVSGVLAAAVQPQSDPLWLGLMSTCTFPAIIHLFQKGRNHPLVENITDRSCCKTTQAQSNFGAPADPTDDSSHFRCDWRDKINSLRPRGFCTTWRTAGLKLLFFKCSFAALATWHKRSRENTGANSFCFFIADVCQV